MKTITEPGRQVEVISEVDVAVVGGGGAGLGAAIAAGRDGAESGPLGPVGLLGGLIGEPGGLCYVDVEKFKLFCDRIMAETGIELWLHSVGVFPAMEGNAVRGVITESKSGRKAILAKG